MDQIKIGKFISECRKSKNITQAQLAEKLNITDRAISKWENGKSLPDSSIMLDLCEILDITVNDLLSGEKVSSEDYAKKMQDRLLEALRGKEKAELMLWRLIILCGVILVTFMATIVIYDAYVYTYWSLAVMGAWCIFGVVLGFLLDKYSLVAVGHCRCEKCGAVYLPTTKAWFLGFGFSLKKFYLKCPHCKKITKHKKALVEE
jgi:transcriptional regulator with XRE-family HTH domain